MESKLEVIAERSLAFSSSGAEVQVLIGRPYKESDGVHFYPYKIKGIGAEEIRRAGGVDEIQALQLALVMIGAELSVHSDLRWNKEYSLGFPKTIHDPVIGNSEEN